MNKERLFWINNYKLKGLLFILIALIMILLHILGIIVMVRGN